MSDKEHDDIEFDDLDALDQIDESSPEGELDGDALDDLGDELDDASDDGLGDYTEGYDEDEDGSDGSSGGASKIVLIAATCLVVGVGGFAAYKKFGGSTFGVSTVAVAPTQRQPEVVTPMGPTGVDLVANSPVVMENLSAAKSLTPGGENTINNALSNTDKTLAKVTAKEATVLEVTAKPVAGYLDEGTFEEWKSDLESQLSDLGAKDKSLTSTVAGIDEELNNEIRAVSDEVESMGKMLVAHQAKIDGYKEVLEGLSDVSSRVDTEMQGIRVQTMHEMNVEMEKMRKKMDAQVEQLAQVVAEQEELAVSKSNGDARKGVSEWKGRTRLKGYQVLSASFSGDFVIVRNSRGSVFTLFDGEKMSVRGKRMTVDSIEEGGYLVNVGKKYFIDENFVKYKSPRVRKARVTKKVVDPVVARDWHVIGYGVKGSYLKAPSGVIVTANVGTRLKGLGKVSKVDANGVTYAGKYKIVMNKEKVF